MKCSTFREASSEARRLARRDGRSYAVQKDGNHWIVIGNNTKESARTSDDASDLDEYFEHDSALRIWNELEEADYMRGELQDERAVGSDPRWSEDDNLRRERDPDEDGFVWP